jgi:hypothetical protein
MAPQTSLQHPLGHIGLPVSPGFCVKHCFLLTLFFPPKRVHSEEGALRLGKGSREDFDWVRKIEQNKRARHLL